MKQCHSPVNLHFRFPIHPQTFVRDALLHLTLFVQFEKT